MFLDRPKSEQPTIEADVLSNGLTVVAKDADFRAIQAVVEKFDEAAQSSYIQVRVIPLQPQARAEKMAEVLKRVYEQVSDSDVTITDHLPARTASQPADPAGNDDILEELERRAAAAPTSAPAVTTRPATVNPPVIVAVDKASNSLIISAARTEMEAIESLLYQLTSSTATIDYETKIFKIQNDPAAIAKTLNDLYNPRRARPASGRGRWGGQGNRRGPSRGNAPRGGPGRGQRRRHAADAAAPVGDHRGRRADQVADRPRPAQRTGHDRADDPATRPRPDGDQELRVLVLKNTNAAGGGRRRGDLRPHARRRRPERSATQQMIRGMVAMREIAGPGQPNLQRRDADWEGSTRTTLGGQGHHRQADDRSGDRGRPGRRHGDRRAAGAGAGPVPGR